MHRLCWLCWIGGAGLIVLSRFELVPAGLGWIGFYVTVAAALLSYVLPTAKPPPADAWTVLTRPMLDSRDHNYQQALARFDQGGTLLCDASAVVKRRDAVTVATLSSVPAADITESSALHDAEQALRSFAALAQASPELTAATAGLPLRVALLTELGPQGVEICRIADGQIEWRS